MGKCHDPVLIKIYEVLKHAIETGKAFCPANSVLLEETLKQSDLETRQITSTIIQELSTGIALQPFPDLCRTEILHFLEATRPWPVEIYPLEQLVWTYIGNIFGHAMPESRMLDNAAMNALKKSWFDLMGRMSFPSLIKSFASSSTVIYRTPDEFYEKLNTNCKLHENDFSSFLDIFLIELTGILDVEKEDLGISLLNLFKKDTQRPTAEESDLSEGIRLFSNMIYHAFRLGKIERQLPGHRIMAGIHAAIRYKGQKHRKGDNHDHLHARAALPYCNIFLTERVLGHLLCDKPLEYDKFFGCQVSWEPEESLRLIEEAIREP
jgi:hypothetical protein